MREYAMPPWATSSPGVDDVIIIMIRDLENSRTYISVDNSKIQKKIPGDDVNTCHPGHQVLRGSFSL